jgi:hypothetical protein
LPLRPRSATAPYLYHEINYLYIFHTHKKLIKTYLYNKNIRKDVLPIQQEFTGYRKSFNAAIFISDFLQVPDSTSFIIPRLIMASPTPREQSLSEFRDQIRQGKPIVGAGAGTFHVVIFHQ